MIEKRRLKLSSPTIDSTTDNICQTVSRQLVGNSQDSQGVSSTHVVNGNFPLVTNIIKIYMFKHFFFRKQMKDCMTVRSLKVFYSPTIISQVHFVLHLINPSE